MDAGLLRSIEKNNNIMLKLCILSIRDFSVILLKDLIDVESAVNLWLN